MQSVEVKDTVSSTNTKSGRQSVINKPATLEALEKQKLLIKEFQDWVWKDAERKRELENIYDEKFGGIKQRHYDGGFLELPGMNPANRLFDYQKNAVALKFLYGLSAYGIASTESIVTNLQLVLSGAKKKELGEMAKQQMYLVMDQLKSQENLKLRLDKSDDKIQYIENALLFHSEKEEEINKRIIAGEEKDKQQDDAIQQQIKKDLEHDEAIAAGVKKDDEQDKQIKEQILKDKEHDQLFEEIKQKDVAQDQLIERLNENIKELEGRIESLKEGQMSRVMGYIVIAMSAAGIILGILHFFI